MRYARRNLAIVASVTVLGALAALGLLVMIMILGTDGTPSGTTSVEAAGPTKIFRFYIKQHPEVDLATGTTNNIQRSISRPVRRIRTVSHAMAETWPRVVAFS